MPAFMAARQRQLRTHDANLTRLVTKNRFMVESVNGELKAWKWLAGTICNKMLPFVGDFFRIIGSVINWYVHWTILCTLGKKLKLCRFSTYTDIFTCFIHRIEVKNLPHI